MSEKRRMLVLPDDMPIVPNPTQKLFAAHCEPAGFEYPKRVIATPVAYSVMDRYNR